MLQIQSRNLRQGNLSKPASPKNFGLLVVVAKQNAARLVKDSPTMFVSTGVELVVAIHGHNGLDRVDVQRAAVAPPHCFRCQERVYEAYTFKC